MKSVNQENDGHEKEQVLRRADCLLHKQGQAGLLICRAPGRANFSVYSSWLNQDELRCAKVERDVIARGVFTSVPDVEKKRMRYVRKYR